MRLAEPGSTPNGKVDLGQKYFGSGDEHDGPALTRNRGTVSEIPRADIAELATGTVDDYPAGLCSCRRFQTDDESVRHLIRPQKS